MITEFINSTKIEQSLNYDTELSASDERLQSLLIRMS
jgi:hypothetical protein